MKRKPRVKPWENKLTVLSPEKVALAFLTSNVTGSLLDRGLASLSAFNAGDVGLAKRLAYVAPSEFGGAQEYFVWAQFRALFLKSSTPGDSRRRENAAKDAFFAAERACKRANKRLRYYGSRPERENPVYRVLLSRARNSISQVLGTLTEASLEAVYDLARPGSGSAVGSIDFRRVSLPWKFSKFTRLSVTKKAAPYVGGLIAPGTQWWREVADVSFTPSGVGSYTFPLDVVDANRIAFVPKDAGTMRTIAVEPHLNLVLQLGIGNYISRRLLSIGIDVRDQTRNQMAAAESARNWTAYDPGATLDLSAASDSLSQGLVERLLPPAWREFLGDMRSEAYVMGKEAPVEYQKWSSMGNGYTFPLETLIFWGLAHSCENWVHSGRKPLVYGDDIIVSRASAALLMELLKYCGFKVNPDKSFVFGPFRESCGEDRWGETRVVPVYLRYIEAMRPTDIYRLLNQLDTSFNRNVVARECFQAHRGQRILRGPRGPDPSGHLFTEDLDHQVARWSKDWQCYTCETAKFVPVKRGIPSGPALVASLVGSQGWDPGEWKRANLRVDGRWTVCRIAAW